MMEFKSVGSIYHLLEPFVHPTDAQLDDLRLEGNYGVYYGVASKVMPKSIVEIGVRFGYSAIAMLLGCGGDASYIGFDNQSYGEVDPNKFARGNINKVCKGTVEIVDINTQLVETLPIIKGLQVDLVHVDGDHSTSGLLHDLDLVSRIVHDGTHIIVDDTAHKGHPELGPATKKWAETHGYEWVEFMDLHGRMVLKKK